MEISKGAQLAFNGQQYKLRDLIAGWDQYPAIEVSAKEMNSWLASPEFLADYPQEIDTGLKVLFFKQKGKYTILVGRRILEDLIKSNPACVVHGKLVSTPSLKKTRIDTDVAPEVVVAPLQLTPSRYQTRNTYPTDRNGDVKVRPRNNYSRSNSK